MNEQSTEQNVLPILKTSEEAKIPVRAHADDAGLDFFALEGAHLGPREGKLIRTGIAIELPEKTVGMICDRSSMAKRGIKTAGGIIDAGYRGEIQIVLWNLTDLPQQIAPGEKVAQMLILPICTPAPVLKESLSVSGRGDKGFGSSGTF